MQSLYEALMWSINLAIASPIHKLQHIPSPIGVDPNEFPGTGVLRLSDAVRTKKRIELINFIWVMSDLLKVRLPDYGLPTMAFIAR